MGNYSRLPARTNLGKTINKTIDKTYDIKTNQTKTVYGILDSVVDGMYKFRIKIFNEKNQPAFIIGPIELQEIPQDLAARIGTPEEMVQEKLMVKVTYTGNKITSKNAKAVLVKDYLNSFSGDDSENVAKANDLPVKGTAFAPPGASMI